MIVNEIYNGSGLGNQLWNYAVTRTIALDCGYQFGVMSSEKFKGMNLFNHIDFGEKVEGGSGPEGGPPTSLPVGIDKYYREEIHPENNHTCHFVFNKDFLNKDTCHIEDNTKIDGNMQSENYILHRKEEIKEWFKMKEEHLNNKEFSNEETCVINLRGGEYIGVKDLFLPKTYFQNAIKHMNDIVGKKLRFIVVTDDVSTAQGYFPDFEVYHISIEWDYSVLYNAKYLIMANSSFSWFPAWTSEINQIVIAPKYWAKHNVSNDYWSCEDSLTRGWLWMDRNGDIFNYEQCLLEKM